MRIKGRKNPGYYLQLAIFQGTLSLADSMGDRHTEDQRPDWHIGAMSMSVYIQNIECHVPDNSYTQSLIKEKMKDWLKGSKKTNRYIDIIYKESNITKRHSIIDTPDIFFPVPIKKKSQFRRPAFATTYSHRPPERCSSALLKKLLMAVTMLVSVTLHMWLRFLVRDFSIPGRIMKSSSG